MYTQIACNEPNSQSPISAQAIAATNATLQSVADSMTSGNAALNDLILDLYGNPSGMQVPGNSGVPTGNQPVPLPGGGVAWVPVPGSSSMFPQWAFDRPGSGFIPVDLRRRCALPVVLPLQTIFATGPAAPVSTINPSGIVPVSAPPVALPECAVNADTICSALRDGCVLSSQVSPEQLYACSKAGYAGNLNKYPAIAARGGAQGGKFFGSLNLNPAPFSPGLGGTAAASSTRAIASVVGIIGLLAGGLLWAKYRKV